MFVHLANSLAWRAITGSEPPTVPPTAKEYERARLTWFDYYDDRRDPVPGASVLQMGHHKGDVPLPENEPVDAARVVALRRGLGKDEVRAGRF